ncbi:MAG: LytTR family DNA-binding domain-containing protein [Bacteroidota bacterium]
MKYPFDPSAKHHFILSVALALWIFIFLYFTEPLDTNEFGDSEKLIFLPLYALLGAFLYLLLLPIQGWLYNRNHKTWQLKQEIILSLVFIIISVTVLRFFYLHVVMDWHPNAYGFWYHLKAILLPAIATVLPIVLIGRYGLGKYKEKRLEQQKIEINGEGNYEGLRLLEDDLIAIKSADNYIEVFHINGNTLKTTLIRNKLSVIEQDFPELTRTHRSYIINPFHFQSWHTEKGKHLLKMSFQIQVPVSKTYLNMAREKLKH